MQLNADQARVAGQIDAFLATIDMPRSDEGAPAEFFIGGYAGTGKTTMLPVIAELIEAKLQSANISADDGACKLAAPTNKAAKRLRVKTGRTVTTIHWLLGAKPKMYLTAHLPKLIAKASILAKEPDDPTTRRKLDHTHKIIEILRQIEALEIRIDANDNRTACEREIERLQSQMMNFPMEGGSINTNDVLIIDESSMVGQDMRDKVKTKNPAAIIWVGDPGQLDPVKAERWFNPPPQTTLTTVVRQNAESGILKLATLIRNGTANTRSLAQLVDSPDVEFVFDGQFQWERLVDEYGDRWITWRNGKGSTLDHPYHTKRLNSIYRYTRGFQSPYPQPGDWLYVDGRFANRCRTLGGPVMLLKGDELIVDTAAAAGSIDNLTLNGCPALKDGFERKALFVDPDTDDDDPRCVCGEMHEQEGIPPVFCPASKSRHAFYQEIPHFHPWQIIADKSQGIYLSAHTRPDEAVGDAGGKPITTLLDPRPILWDDNQRNLLWRLDKQYIAACGGDLMRSKSPLKATLQAVYGYALSAHQAQGSEWDAITVFWDPKMLKQDTANAVRWLYTAVSRAKSRVCIVTI